MRCLTLLVAIATLLSCGQAVAIPPPWTLEEGKAKADLIVIARTAKIEPVENVRGADSRIGLEPLEVLRGQLDEKQNDIKPYLLFSKPRERVGPGGIRVHVVGGTGQPKVAEGQTALVFLREDPNEKDSFRAVFGSFGYMAISAEGEEARAAVKKRIEMHRGWCARIKDQAARKAMEGYYAKALEAVEKQGLLEIP